MRSDGFRHWKILGGALCTLAAMLLMGNNGVVGAGSSKSKVKSSATVTPIGADGKQTVTVTLIVDKGWHIYANPVKNEMLESTKTIIKITAAAKLANVDVRYPAGKFYKDKFGIESMVYENKVEIPVVIQRAAGDTSPLDVDVTFGACDDASCLIPATVRSCPNSRR